MIATNVYGNSAVSDLSNGAVIMTYSAAPSNLIEEYSQRAATTLGLSWTAPDSDGGAAVFDYTVSYDQGINSYIILQQNILLTELFIEGLTSGTVYKFKVQARN